MNLAILEALLYVIMIAYGFFILRHGEWFLQKMAGPSGSWWHTVATLNPRIIHGLFPGLGKLLQSFTKPLLLIGGLALVVIGSVRLVVMFIAAATP